MGVAAAAVIVANSSTRSRGTSAVGSSHAPASATTSAANASASGARITVGATDPSATRTSRASSSIIRHNPATAMTMAFLVPIFENEPGPRRTGHRAPRMSSSGSSAVRFTPTRNSRHGIDRVMPPARPTSTSASYTASTGSASPAT